MLDDQPSCGPQLALLQGGLAAPQARYEQLARIGSGRMADVWLAHDLIFDRPVALKRLRKEQRRDLRARAAFAHEVAITASLRHPSLHTALDAGEDGDGLYLVLEHLPGPTLRDHMTRTGPLAIPEAARVAATVADGLEHAHRRGVVHCDVRPANILLGVDARRVVLTDFGVATSAEPGAALTGNHWVPGIPEYLAPERAMGRPGTPASDVYSLGVMLYEMLTGRLPLLGDTPAATAVAQWAATVPPPGQFVTVPWAVERVVLRALEKHPGDRYPSAAEFGADLRRAVADPPATGEGLRTRLRARLRAGRPSRAAAAVYAVAGSAGTYGAVLLLG